MNDLIIVENVANLIGLGLGFGFGIVALVSLVGLLIQGVIKLFKHVS